MESFRWKHIIPMSRDEEPAGLRPRSRAESQQFVHPAKMNEPLPCGGRCNGETDGRGRASAQKLISRLQGVGEAQNQVLRAAGT